MAHYRHGEIFVRASQFRFSTETRVLHSSVNQRHEARKSSLILDEIETFLIVERGFDALPLANFLIRI
jgi:hypothetical protein